MDAVVGESTLTFRDLSNILVDVNKIRLAVGIGEGKLPELPKGVKSNPQQCVLAKALSNGWEVEVDNAIALNHPYAFDKPFDWEKAVATLRELGFEVSLDDYNEGYYEEEPDYRITISLTPGMNELIRQFDDGLIPHLVLND